MLTIRPFTMRDKPAVERLRLAQQFEYVAPDWSKLPVSAIADRDGQVEMAIFLRKTCEAYMLFDPTAPMRKRYRLGEFLAVHQELIPPAIRAGFSDVHCWLPPEIEPQFGKVLQHLGWVRPLWKCYSKELL